VAYFETVAAGIFKECGVGPSMFGAPALAATFAIRSTSASLSAQNAILFSFGMCAADSVMPKNSAIAASPASNCNQPSTATLRENPRTGSNVS
jgi:hypothetical protein